MRQDDEWKKVWEKRKPLSETDLKLFVGMQAKFNECQKDRIVESSNTRRL